MVPSGTIERRAQGLETSRCEGTAAALLERRSWPRWEVLLGFLTANMGVLEGEEVGCGMGGLGPRPRLVKGG